MTGHNELIGLSASRMVALLDRGAISPVDALEALEARTAKVDPLINALPTLCFDRAHDNARRLQDMPAEERHPDFSDAVEAFTVQRALFYAVKLGDALATAGHLFNPQVVWNIEKGLKTDAASIRSAMAAQGRLFGKASAFMRDHDLLICPATIMPPFPAGETHPGSSAGVPVSEYYDWLKIVYVVSAATLPVITVPCGFTASGLPLAIQLIGRPHGEYELFRHARYIEEILGWDAAPIDPAE